MLCRHASMHACDKASKQASKQASRQAGRQASEQAALTGKRTDCRGSLWLGNVLAFWQGVFCLSCSRSDGACRHAVPVSWSSVLSSFADSVMAAQCRLLWS